MASASTGTAGASPPAARLWDRGEVIGAAVLALTGIAWFGWAHLIDCFSRTRCAAVHSQDSGCSCLQAVTDYLYRDVRYRRYQKQF